jgi:hypothetical protein
MIAVDVVFFIDLAMDISIPDERAPRPERAKISGMGRAWIAGAWLSLAATIVGCGGRQGLLQADEGADAGATVASVGPVDLTQAPPALPMTCDQGVGTIAFDNPCLVGLNLTGDRSKPGLHVVECHFAAPSHPVAWTFMLPLAQLAKLPNQPLTFPSHDVPPPPGPGQLVDVGGLAASVSSVAGTVTFSRIDPTGRAFIARFMGTFIWKEASGSTFTCAVDAPFWGAPGGFL